MEPETAAPEAVPPPAAAPAAPAAPPVVQAPPGFSTRFAQPSDYDTVPRYRPDMTPQERKEEDKRLSHQKLLARLAQEILDTPVEEEATRKGLEDKEWDARREVHEDLQDYDNYLLKKMAKREDNERDAIIDEWEKGFEVIWNLDLDWRKELLAQHRKKVEYFIKVENDAQEEEEISLVKAARRIERVLRDQIVPTAKTSLKFEDELQFPPREQFEAEDDKLDGVEEDALDEEGDDFDDLTHSAKSVEAGAPRETRCWYDRHRERITYVPNKYEKSVPYPLPPYEGSTPEVVAQARARRDQAIRHLRDEIHVHEQVIFARQAVISKMGTVLGVSNMMTYTFGNSIRTIGDAFGGLYDDVSIVSSATGFEGKFPLLASAGEKVAYACDCCTVHRGEEIQGEVCVTPNYLCFWTDNNRLRNFVVALDQVTSIQKATTVTVATGGGNVIPSFTIVNDPQALPDGLVVYTTEKTVYQFYKFHGETPASNLIKQQSKSKSVTVETAEEKPEPIRAVEVVELFLDRSWRGKEGRVVPHVEGSYLDPLPFYDYSVRAPPADEAVIA
eukprot:TRINITY_DN30717_c0_g1_i1.p1 TRINITY_DN30717_c0_g1~~TRINITY_DN30717_c0_g1_i1.p1  ORF type:complete len:569 (-),score=121.50 TRINITY_DN30717_c0_g1_i1:52-1728(-)